MPNTSLGTHFDRFAGKVLSQSGVPTDDVKDGDVWFDTDTNQLFCYYDGVWYGMAVMTTSTSTSTSSTSTSTSTTA